MFCQRFLKLYGINPNLPIFVIYTDDVHFTKDGIQNVHNQHLWADAILPSHQQRFSINIWAGTCGDNSFGPHILPNRLTWLNYKAFLGSNMPDFLAEVLLINIQELHFEHDAAPAYFSLLACRFLIQKFLSEIELRQIFRQHITCQEFGIVFRWQ
jgi:hypothetical protein